MGIDPVHFGVIMVLNLCIGLCTPLVGTVLFIGVGVVGTTIQKVVKPLLPLFCGNAVFVDPGDPYFCTEYVTPRLFGF